MTAAWFTQKKIKFVLENEIRTHTIKAQLSHEHTATHNAI